MRLFVSHQLLREEYMRADVLSHYRIIVEVMHIPYTETSNIKLLMLLLVWTLLKIHINKVKQGFVLV